MAGGTPRLRPFYASRGGGELPGYSVVPAAAGPCELVGVRGVDRDMHALRPRLFRASRGGGEVTRQAARPGRGRSALAGAGESCLAGRPLQQWPICGSRGWRYKTTANGEK